MKRTRPPQELESRRPGNEQLRSTMETNEDDQKLSQLLISLPRAQRGVGANHALSLRSLGVSYDYAEIW
jgi:hypothetical protein